MAAAKFQARSTRHHLAQRRSTQPLNQTVLNPAAFDSSSADLPIGGSSAATAVADFNQDGIPDLVVGLASAAVSNNLVVFLGSGNGSFKTGLTLATTELNPFSIVTGDFNGDGKADIATANYGSDSVSVLLGNGTGNFTAAQTYEVGLKPNQVAAADFNRDGKLDLVTANADPANTLSVVLNDGSGGFRSAKTLKTEQLQPLAVAIGDLDRDGELDLISANAGSSSLSLFFGKGNGEFEAATQVYLSSMISALSSVVVGDFDGDHKLDLAAGSLAGNNRDLVLLLGDGKGGFADAKVFSVGGAVSALVTGDFNNDEKLDLAASLNNSASVSMLFGDGAGSLNRSSTAFVNSAATGLSTADFDQDGRLDLVAASGGEDNASIVLNRTTAVVLRSSEKSGEVDGSLESKAGMTVDLADGTLLVQTSPILRLSVKGFQNVAGTQVKDQIDGSESRNRLSGNQGGDQITGLGGNDVLSGGEGRDRLQGGEGNDRLTGGTGKDWLKGEAGFDRFVFDHEAVFRASDGVDRLQDFERGERIILDRGTFTVLNQKVSFESVQTIAAAKTSEAFITYVQAKERLYYNANGSLTGFGDGGLFAVLEASNSAAGNLTAANFLTQK